MNIRAINDWANRTPWIRPLKWAISSLVHRTILAYLMRDPKKSIIAVHGLQRTGNHAVINWIMKGSCRPSMLCNDLDHRDHPQNAPIKKYDHGKGNPLIISSYEDRRISDMPVIPMLESYGPHADRRAVIIIRDPFNLFASRYVWKRIQGEWFRNDAKYRERVIEVWKDHARNSLSWISEPRMGDIQRTVVNYNKWVMDTEYREMCALALDLKLPHAGLNEVSGLGGGSSFHGTSYINGTPDDYNRRFIPLLADPNFERIFSDPVLWELSDALFGNVPGTERLRRAK
jgi:hypothetical protein